MSYLFGRLRWNVINVANDKGDIIKTHRTLEYWNGGNRFFGGWKPVKENYSSYIELDKK